MRQMQPNGSTKNKSKKMNHLHLLYKYFLRERNTNIVYCHFANIEEWRKKKDEKREA